MNLLDTTSGAAQSMQTLLAALVGRGWEAVALQAQLFDSPLGAHGVQAAATAEGLEGHPVLQATVQGVQHLMVRTASRNRMDMTTREQEIYMGRVRGELRSRRPDLVILFGAFLLEAAVMREAKDLGIPVVFYLANPGYGDSRAFRDLSVIVTDTHATARLYRERLGIECVPVGKFIDPSAVKATERRPQFATFINPSLEKGANVFLPMAKLAEREMPDMRFLVVESRGRWADAITALGYSPGDFPNVQVVPHQIDMRPVYAATRALLVPSVWHESGARVIVEALINGIPVLASAGAGSPELLGGSGVVFELPAEVMANHRVRASDSAVRPWLAELSRLWNEAAYYETKAAQALERSASVSIDASCDRFLRAVALLLPAAGTRP